jgi:hypothetical protein
MDELKNIIAIVSGLLGIIVTLLTLVVRPLRKIAKDNHADHEAARLRMDTLERNIAETHKRLLRADVWSDTLPLSERVDAGEEYIRQGGNGATKAQHALNVEELNREVRKNYRLRRLSRRRFFGRAAGRALLAMAAKTRPSR